MAMNMQPEWGWDGTVPELDVISSAKKREILKFLVFSINSSWPSIGSIHDAKNNDETLCYRFLGQIQSWTHVDLIFFYVLPCYFHGFSKFPGSRIWRPDHAARWPPRWLTALESPWRIRVSCCTTISPPPSNTSQEKVGRNLGEFSRKNPCFKYEELPTLMWYHPQKKIDGWQWLRIETTTSAELFGMAVAGAFFKCFFAKKCAVLVVQVYERIFVLLWGGWNGRSLNHRCVHSFLLASSITAPFLVRNLRLFLPCVAAILSMRLCTS